MHLLWILKSLFALFCPIYSQLKLKFKEYGYRLHVKFSLLHIVCIYYLDIRLKDITSLHVQDMFYVDCSCTRNGNLSTAFFRDFESALEYGITLSQVNVCQIQDIFEESFMAWKERQRPMMDPFRAWTLLVILHMMGEQLYMPVL